MKQFYSVVAIAIALWMGGVSASAQTDYTLTVEAFATHTTPYANLATGVPDDLNGMTTYRFYVNMLNANDFLSAVFGNDLFPLAINTSTNSFYNHAFATGSDVGGIGAAFLALIPAMAYDSFVTIGLTSAAVAPQANPNLVESVAQPWKPHFTAGTPQAGTNVLMDDNTGGSWFVLNGSPNGYPSAAGQGVLILQLTTAGTPSGTLNVQIFPQSIGNNAVSRVFNFNGPGTYEPSALPVPGCTDMAACNFDENANTDDGSCEYPEMGYTCEGDCISDVDGDMVCDANEIGGCTDMNACNYNALATDDDGSCSVNDVCGVCGGTGIPMGDCDCFGNQLDVLGVCGGGCTADEDMDGICDDVDPCVGAFDSCGVCNGPGSIYACGCTEVPEGDCDCFGNQTDAVGVCGGDCAADVDMDGVCDTDEIPGCTDMMACNYNMNATDDDGSCLQLDECGICGGDGIPAGDCDCDGNQLDAVGVCGGDCTADMDGDGVCDTDEVFGCTDMGAPNYNPEATEDDGSCIVCTLVAGNVEITDVSCFGGADGATMWNVSGGEGLIYTLMPGDVTNDSGMFDALTAGVYTILAMDVNACVLEQIVTISEPDVLEVTIDEITDAVDNDGAIDISIDGGVEPYVITWTGTAGAATGYSSTEEDIEGLATGTYAVVVTDANGCTAEGEAVIEVNGMDEVLGFGFVVFPNPSTEVATLVWGGSQAVEWMTVADGLGRVVESVRIAGTEGRMELNAGNFSAGVYTISVGASTGVSTQRWVVAN